MQLNATRQKKQFVKSSELLNHEPLLLVRRPKSATANETSKGQKLLRTPGFMRPIPSKVARPSSLNTIDIFTAQPTRKKNLWENSGEKTVVRFTSVVRPCAALSEKEYMQLKNGYRAIKQSLSLDTDLDADFMGTSSKSVSSAKPKQCSVQPHTDFSSGKSSDTNTDGLNAGEAMPKDEKYNQKTAVIKTSITITEPLSIEVPKSSSFITEIETDDVNTTYNNEKTIKVKSEPPVYDRNKDVVLKDSTTSYINGMSREHDSNKALRSDTRQIPFRLPSVSYQTQSDNVLTVSSSKSEPIAEREDARKDSNSTLAKTKTDMVSNQVPTKLAVTVLDKNISKTASNRKSIKMRPQSFPLMGKADQLRPSVHILKIPSAPKQIRRATPKSVNFAEKQNILFKR